MSGIFKGSRTCRRYPVNFVSVAINHGRQRDSEDRSVYTKAGLEVVKQSLGQAVVA